MAGGEIFTLGTSTRSPEEFLALLRHWQITLVADVRSWPQSRLKHFCQEDFSRLLATGGVEYVHLGESLGGYRRGGYAAHMKTEAFARGLERLEELARDERIAVVCAERLPWRCHRRFIGQALSQRGWHVVHIIDQDRTWAPDAGETSLPLDDDQP